MVTFPNSSINPKMGVHQYHPPQPIEMFTNHNDGVLFSKLDLFEAYLQTELDKDSQKISGYQYA